MRILISLIVTMAHALWLGGIVALFIFASSTFAHSRELGLAANPVLFQKWESWRVIVAAVALVGGILWWVIDRRRLKAALAILLALATVAGLLSTLFITPRIEQLRVAGRTDTPEFRAAHGQSMMAYSTEALLLIGAGVLIPFAQRGRK